MIDELLQYQEADGRLRAVEQEIAATEERKKYMSARKFLEKAPEKLDALDAKAAELKHLFELLEKKYAEIADTIKDYENLDEMVDEQGGEISFYKKNASQIADNLRGLKAEINKLASQIESASAEYQAAKKQTIASGKLPWQEISNLEKGLRRKRGLESLYPKVLVAYRRISFLEYPFKAKKVHPAAATAPLIPSG